MDRSGFLSSRGQAHPPEEILERYAMNRATEKECERVEEHILLCESCRVRLDESGHWVALMKAALPEGPGKPESAQPLWRRWWQSASASMGSMPRPALAGAFAAFVAILWLAPTPLSRQYAGSEPPQAVSLSALRGNEDLRVRVRSGAPLQLQIGDSGIMPATVAIVDAAGKQIWSGPLRGTQASAPALAKGTYWVRLFSTASGEQLKEYGLLVE